MKFYFLLVITILPAASAIGSVTLDIKIADLQNSSGAVTNGMEYGIVVDTDGNGFEAGFYTGFDITTNGQFLSSTSGVTGDWFVFAGSLGTGQPLPTTGTVFGEGSGAISNQQIDFTNLSQGDEFAVMWFPGGTAASSGDDYGFFIDAGATKNMIIPSDSNVSDAPSFISTRSVDFQVQAVPEPSIYGFAGLFCFIWLVARRRFINLR